MSDEADYDVFISYVRKDPAVGPRAVAELHEALSAAGLRVFRDDGIGLHDGITGEIERALTRSKAVLAVYSRNYLEREACAWELSTAYLEALGPAGSADALRRIMVLNPEEDGAHIQPSELRDAKWAPLPLGDDARARYAQHVAARVAPLRGPLASARRTSREAVWRTGHRPMPAHFRGRNADLLAVHANLHAARLRATHSTSGPAVTQLRGMSGIGKSSLAAAYAHRYGSAYPGGVFWFDAGGSDSDGTLAQYRTALVDAAEGLGLDVRGLPSSAAQVRLGAALRERGTGPYLWVVDDVPARLGPTELTELLAPSATGHTLLTLCDTHYRDLGVPVRVGPLSRSAAYDLLTAERARSTESSPAERDAALALVEEAEGHPMVLRALAREAATGEQSYESLVRLLSEDPARFPGGESPGGEGEWVQTVVSRGYRTLLADGVPGVADVVRLGSLLASASISGEVLHRVVGPSYREAVAALLEAGLLDAAGDSGWRLHSTIGRVLHKQYADPEEDQRLLREVAPALVALLSEDGTPAAELRRSHLLAHARKVGLSGVCEASAQLLALAADNDEARGDHLAAEPLRRRCLALREAHRGPGDPLAEEARLALVAALEEAGRFQEALEAIGPVADRYETGGGDASALAHRARARLGSVLGRFGRTAPAVALLRGSLEGLDRLAHPVDAEVLSLRLSLARTLEERYEFDEAEALLKVVLDTSRTRYGDRYPHTLALQAEFAALLARRQSFYRFATKSSKAEKLAQEVESSLSEMGLSQHPGLEATSLALGKAMLIRSVRPLPDIARAREALRHYRNAVTGRRDRLGFGNPLTLLTLVEFAGALVSLSNGEEAVPLLQLAVDRLTGFVDERHPRLLDARYSLGMALLQSDRNEAAAEQFSLCRDGWAEMLGDDHDVTLGAEHQRGFALYWAGGGRSAVLDAVARSPRTPRNLLRSAGGLIITGLPLGVSRSIDKIGDKLDVLGPSPDQKKKVVREFLTPDLFPE